MTEREFVRLLDHQKYQVFLLCSPIPIPFHFAIHTWFVINVKGKISRYEFGKFRKSPYPYGIGLLRDFFGPTTGMNKYPWKLNPRFHAKVLQYIEGDEASTAAKLAEFIEKNSEAYPLKKRYKYLGPNSNTYVQWVLNKIPDTGFKLPRNAIGRNFKIKNNA